MQDECNKNKEGSPAFYQNNFLPSSEYSAMFWVQYANNIDNTLMFYLLLSSVYNKSKTSQLLIPCQPAGRRCTRSGEGTQTGPQLTEELSHTTEYHAQYIRLGEIGQQEPISVQGWYGHQ